MVGLLSDVFGFAPPQSRGATPQEIAAEREGKFYPVLLARPQGMLDSAAKAHDLIASGVMPSQMPEGLLGPWALMNAFGAAGPLRPMIAARQGVGGLVTAGTAGQRQLNELGLYSKALEAAHGIQQQKGTGQQFAAQLTKAGVKPDETKWTGLDEVLAKPSVTKDEIISHLEANPVNVERVVLGGARSADEQKKLDNLAIDLYGAEMRFLRPFEQNRVIDAHSTVDGGIPNPKFESYTLPGGENYREVLWKLPGQKARLGRYEQRLEEIRRAHGAQPGEGYANFATAREREELERLAEGYDKAEDFTGGHFDQPNVLAHARVNDRVSANGEKTLFIEELQSDWAQKGRKAGFSTGERAELPAGIKTYGPDDANNPGGPGVHTVELPSTVDGRTLFYGQSMDEAREKARLFIAKPKHNAPPLAPFVDKTQKWVEFGLKNLLKDAAEGGYDRVAWTPGKVQAERYDLSRHLDRIEYKLNKDGTADFNAIAKDDGQAVMSNRGATKESIADSLGKEVADSIFNDAGIEDEFFAEGYKALIDTDLKVGGEGMKAFYDKIIPNAAQKLIKKLDKDAKIERAGLSTGEETYSLWNKHTGASVGGGYTKSKASEKVASRPDDWEMRLESGGTQETLSIPITPKMREKILNEGQPLFAQGGEGGLLTSALAPYFREDKPTLLGDVIQ